MNYAQMSDFEISVRVGDLKGVRWANLDENYNPLSIWNGDDLCAFDPCNSWADAGPIIAENKITILTDEKTEEWSAAVVQDFCDERAFKYSNCAGSPLRAAMVTFLMMQESKCSN